MSIETQFQNNAITLLRTLRDINEFIEIVVPSPEECERQVDEGIMGRVEAKRCRMLRARAGSVNGLVIDLLATDPTYASLLPKGAL